MTSTVLVAVHDSAPAFAAAECAIALARQLGASIYALQVVETPSPAEADSTPDGVLSRVARLAARSGVEFHGSTRQGPIAPTILDTARETTAAWIVMARVDRPGHTIPGIGSRTMRVIEFSEVPVIVVPEPGRGAGAG